MYRICFLLYHKFQIWQVANRGFFRLIVRWICADLCKLRIRGGYNKKKYIIFCFLFVNVVK